MTRRVKHKWKFAYGPIFPDSHNYLWQKSITAVVLFCYAYMNDDMTMIVKRYPESMTVLRVYALGDVHVGSPVYDDRATKIKLKIIKS